MKKVINLTNKTLIIASNNNLKGITFKVTMRFHKSKQKKIIKKNWEVSKI